MVVTKHKDVTKQVSVKYSAENFVFGESLISTYSIFLGGGWEGKGGGVGGGAYLSLSERGRRVGWGWALIRGWAHINFFCP